MTTIGVTAAAILASLLLALLDMSVYRESFGLAFYKQSLAYNSWQTYLIVIGAFIFALIQDWRSHKRSKGRQQSQRLRGEQRSDRNKR